MQLIEHLNKFFILELSYDDFISIKGYSKIDIFLDKHHAGSVIKVGYEIKSNNIYRCTFKLKIFDQKYIEDIINDRIIFSMNIPFPKANFGIFFQAKVIPKSVVVKKNLKRLLKRI